MSILTKNGTIASLRVNERGDRFGGSADNIIAEVIVQLTDDSGAYGFRLLDDENRPLRQGYLDLLRDALAYGHDVQLDVDIADGRSKGIIKRIALRAPQIDRSGPIAPWLRSRVVTHM